MRSSHILVALFVIQVSLLGQGLNLRLRDLDGRKVDVADICRERPLVLSFWATWCKPCREEMKQTQRLFTAYSDSGVAFLAVAIDESRDQAKVRSFLGGNRFTFPVALDPEQKAMKRMGLQDVPGVFVIGRDGRTIWQHAGYKPGDEIKLEEEIRKLVRRNPPDSAEVKKETGESCE